MSEHYIFTKYEQPAVYPSPQQQAEDAAVLRELGYSMIAGIAAASQADLHTLVTSELTEAGSLRNINDSTSAELRVGPYQLAIDGKFVTLANSVGMWEKPTA